MGNQTEYEKVKSEWWKKYYNRVVCSTGDHKYWFELIFEAAYRYGIEEAEAQTSNVTYIKTPVPGKGAIPDATKDVDRAMIAAMAMQGLLNATSVERFSLRIKPESIAEAAVEYADALLAELEKVKE